MGSGRKREMKRVRPTLFGGERYEIRKANIGDTSLNKEVYILHLNDYNKKLLSSAYAWANWGLNKLGQPPSP